jgi:hypothetical protein
MTMSKTDLRDILRERYGAKPPGQVGPTGGPAPAPVTWTGSTGTSFVINTTTTTNGDPQPERAFVAHAESGRTVITAPVREVAAVNAGFTYLRGRFVEADNANANGAMWTTEDLQMGGATIAGGPLNWLHDDKTIIGSLLQGQMVAGDREAAGIGNHIVADAAVWRFLYPEAARAIEKAAAEGQLYYSMECISKEVACIDAPGRPGCGESFPYADYDAGKACGHLRERSSIRRFVDPIFLGGAIIVPPILPGWSGAEATVVRQAAMLVDEHGQALTDHMTIDQAHSLAEAVLGWANRSRS